MQRQGYEAAALYRPAEVGSSSPQLRLPGLPLRRKRSVSSLLCVRSRTSPAYPFLTAIASSRPENKAAPEPRHARFDHTLSAGLMPFAYCRRSASAGRSLARVHRHDFWARCDHRLGNRDDLWASRALEPSADRSLRSDHPAPNAGSGAAGLSASRPCSSPSRPSRFRSFLDRRSLGQARLRSLRIEAQATAQQVCA